jgi:acyl carrier protein
MAEDTLATVRRILIEKLDLEEDAVLPEADIAADLGADSLDALELVMALEEELNIELDPSETEQIRTVADLVTIIDTLRD